MVSEHSLPVTQLTQQAVRYVSEALRQTGSPLNHDRMLNSAVKNIISRLIVLTTVLTCRYQCLFGIQIVYAPKASLHSAMNLLPITHDSNMQTPFK